jgi:nucleoside-diphosphate-sugar epimerase
VRVVVTGGAGFIGRALVKRLVDRGGEVVALVRDPARARFLEGNRVRLLANDLSGVKSIAVHARGADALVHAAGSYRVGIKPAERPQMLDANLGTSERVLDAAVDAGVQRIVYVSTVGVFGDTRGEVVDETYRRDPADGFVSYYDESKYLAHVAAEKRIRAGAPIVIVQPSQVYGPHDHSITSEQLALAHAGRLRYLAMANTGLGWVHVDDLVVNGFVAALEKGRVGESYVLSGERMTLREAAAAAARVGGRRPPRLIVPTALLKAAAVVSDPLGGLPGLPDNLREVIRAGDGVTYYASEEKAREELGFSPRSLEQGIADTWGDRRSTR